MRHDLRRAPNGMIQVAITNPTVKHIEHIGLRMSPNQIIRPPTQVILCSFQLPGQLQTILERQHSPGRKRSREGNGQAELRMIPGIMPASGEIQADIGSVIKIGITAPRNKYDCPSKLKFGLFRATASIISALA